MTDVKITKDAVQDSWVYSSAPVSWRPYLKLARLDRPVGVWLLLWPCLWSITLSTGAQAGYFHFWTSILVGILFAIGAVVMRGAGCTYNDIIDRDFDAVVDRTKSRPIPAGEVSLSQAWLFLVLQCVIGLGVLLLLSPMAIWLGLGSLLLVAIYPFMKRWTFWPQAWLGLTFNWGALMGWAAMTNDIGWPAIILYIGGIFWTLGYDTVYALQDSEDDALIGVKSTALKFGDQTPIAVGIFYWIFFLCLLGIGMLAKLSVFYYTVLVIAAVHLIAQLVILDIRDGHKCLRIFRSNIGFGWIVFAAMLAGQFTI